MRQYQTPECEIVIVVTEGILCNSTETGAGSTLERPYEGNFGW